MKYKQPNQDNVKWGDKLITEIQGTFYAIPIEKVEKDGVRTISYNFSKKQSIICSCPYAQAIIKTKDNTILIGKKTRLDIKTIEEIINRL